LRHRAVTKGKYVPSPETWPRELNRILDGRLNYPSPTVPGLMQGTLTFLAIQDLSEKIIMPYFA
jgi:hypothetical protein